MNRKQSDTGHLTPFHQCVVDIIRKIPRGKVATYGQIAALAGSPRSARQVVRILHSCSRKYKLPWHRVINKQGKISLPKGAGYEEQILRLKREGVQMSATGRVDLNKFQLEFR